MNNNTKTKLVEAYLAYDGKDYYFNLKYLCEDEYEKYYIIFPKVATNIPISNLTFDTTFFERTIVEINFNNNKGLHKIMPDSNGRMFYKELIEVKRKKMTMKEIEKELGYRVILVD